MSLIQDSYIKDKDTGIYARVETEGNLAVILQNQHTEVVDYRMQIDQDTFTLDANTSIGDTEIDVVLGHGATADDLIYLIEDGRYFEALVLVANATSLELDSPLDYAFTTSADCTRGIYHLNVDGSGATIIAHTSVPPGVQWDVVRVMFTILDNTPMDDSLFGGIAALDKGILLRVKNSIYKNIFNCKTNGCFADQMYDVSYAPKAPAGFYGLRARRTFAGQEKNGITLRLVGDDEDELQLLIQDDLTGLTDFRMVVQGHVVSN